MQAAKAAAAPLAEEQLLAARQRAATAATTLPPGIRLYAALPPPQPAACQVSPSKAAALAGARKQLDPRWDEERRQLLPELEHLWMAAERLPGRPAPAELPVPLPVPLPDQRRLTAGFLGLRL